MKQVSESRLIPELKKSIKASGSLASWAKKHGYSRQFVGDVVKGNRSMPDGMCKALGIQRVVEVKHYWVED